MRFMEGRLRGALEGARPGSSALAAALSYQTWKVSRAVRGVAVLMLLAALATGAAAARTPPHAEVVLGTLERVLKEQPARLDSRAKAVLRDTLRRLRDRQLRLLVVKYNLITTLTPRQQATFQKLIDVIRGMPAAHTPGHRVRDLALGLRVAEARSGARLRDGPPLPPPIPEAEDLLAALLAADRRGSVRLSLWQWRQLASVLASRLDDHLLDHALHCIFTPDQRGKLIRLSGSGADDRVRSQARERAEARAGKPRRPFEPAVRQDFVVPEAGAIAANAALAKQLKLTDGQWKRLGRSLYQGMCVEQAIDQSVIALDEALGRALGKHRKDFLPARLPPLYQFDMTEQMERLLQLLGATTSPGFMRAA